MRTRLHIPTWLLAAAMLTGCEQAAPPLEPNVSFFGIGDRADRVVFVIDTTGSRHAAFKYVQAELLAAIRRMNADQRFGIILFGARSPDPLTTAGRARLLVAGQSAYERASRFVLGHEEVGPADKDAAWRAMRAAFEIEPARPDAIFLLTERVWPDRLARYVNEFAMHASGESASDESPRPVRVHTVGFIHAEVEPLLVRIARQNGGRYTFIPAVDLGKGYRRVR